MGTKSEEGGIVPTNKVVEVTKLLNDLNVEEREQILKALKPDVEEVPEGELHAEPGNISGIGRGRILSVMSRGRGVPRLSHPLHSTPHHVRNIPPIGAERRASQLENTEPQYFITNPRLPSFTGDRRSEVPYRQWRAEVRGLQADISIPTTNIRSAIRRSLKGMAAECMLHLGSSFDPEDLLSYFDKLFGEVLTSEQVLAQFYAVSQEPDESVAAWGCRLREILCKIPDQEYRQDPQASNMLRQKFWSGLYNHKIKEATRHHYDNGEDFHSLLVACRAVEQEAGIKSRKTVQQIHKNSTAVEVNKLDLILRKVEQLEKKVSELEVSKQRQRARDADASETHVPKRIEESKSYFRGSCHFCKRWGHKSVDCYKKKRNDGEDTKTRNLNG